MEPAKDGFNFNYENHHAPLSYSFKSYMPNYASSTKSIGEYIGYSRGFDQFGRYWYAKYLEAYLGVTWDVKD